MLNQNAQAPRPDRRAPAAASSVTWLDRWGASALFVGAMLLCAASFVRFVNASPEKQPQAKMKIKARPVVDVFSLHRAPTVAAGQFRYAVLGYGQDTFTGQQIVWMRSITTNRVGGFKEGERLFEGPVKVASIESERLVLSYRGEEIEAPIQP